MLSIHHVSKGYGIQSILEDVSFSIKPLSRIGLIGPNGCGKTTLLRITAGLEPPDAGSVIRTQANIRVGYLAQGAEFYPGATVQSYLIGNAYAAAAEQEIQELASALAASPNDERLQSSYDRALQRLSRPEALDQALLASLGLDRLPMDASPNQLSGGQKTRLMLARVLLEQPDLLLLDEPTNHLDIEMLQWLEDWLRSFIGAALIVSHDRAFLDNTVKEILDLDPASHTLRAYAGNYSTYLDQYVSEQSRRDAAYRDQQYEIRRMKQDIARTKEQARHVEITTTPRQPGVRRIAKKVAAKAKAREHKLVRYLESDERVDRPKPSWQLKLEFEAPPHASQDILSAEQLTVGYPQTPPILEEINFKIRNGQRIALTGPNGSGKTTLLRTMAGRLPPLAGRIRLGPSVKLGYMAQEQELLNPDHSALESIQGVTTFSETEARNFLHYFLFEDDAPLRPSRELSFGERARLELALLVVQGSTFLLLDEPINHLDIPSRARFEQALTAFPGTVLAVVHDRYFIEHFATSIWTIKQKKVEIW